MSHLGVQCLSRIVDLAIVLDMFLNTFLEKKKSNLPFFSHWEVGGGGGVVIIFWTCINSP